MRIAPLPVVYKPCVHKGLAVIYPGNVAEYSVGGAGIEVHISAVSDIYFFIRIISRISILPSALASPNETHSSSA